MAVRKLILTADETTWPQNKTEKVVFIGEWCRRHSRKSHWQHYDFEIIPYHWNDRQKLFKDYKKLQLLYKKLIFDLSNKLNQIHEVDFSIRYWKILVGPWLGLFIEMLFDRYFMLKYTLESKRTLECEIIEREKLSLVPNDMKHFCNLHIEDEWNEAVFGQLLEFCWKDKINIKKTKKSIFNYSSKNKVDTINNFYPKEHLKLFFIALFNKLFPKNDSCFFIESYFSLNTNFKLQIILGQFPKLWIRQAEKFIKPTLEKRQWSLKKQKTKKITFENVIRDLIPLHIPTTYLEGYKDLKQSALQCGWPKRPKSIFTSSAYNSSDFFKIWAAEKIELGAKLFIGQHGGHLGMTPFAFYEKHQIDIADKWLSWGWSDPSIPKITPVGNFKNYGRKVQYDPDGTALMVEMTLSRYSDQMTTFPISSQWLDYLEDQKCFLKTLPNELRKKVLVRLLSNDYGWDQESRWKDFMPELNLDPGNKNIKKLIKKSRLFIATYNATSYLETLNWNIPTIIFWNPEHWELKKEVKPYFRLLSSVGIFHETPKSAAQQMINVWDDIDSWWYSVETQNARKKFCRQFSYDNYNLIEDLKKIFVS